MAELLEQSFTSSDHLKYQLSGEADVGNGIVGWASDSGLLQDSSSRRFKNSSSMAVISQKKWEKLLGENSSGLHRSHIKGNTKHYQVQLGASPELPCASIQPPEPKAVIRYHLPRAISRSSRVQQLPEKRVIIKQASQATIPQIQISDIPGDQKIRPSIRSHSSSMLLLDHQRKTSHRPVRDTVTVGSVISEVVARVTSVSPAPMKKSPEPAPPKPWKHPGPSPKQDSSIPLEHFQMFSIGRSASNPHTGLKMKWISPQRPGTQNNTDGTGHLPQSALRSLLPKPKIALVGSLTPEMPPKSRSICAPRLPMPPRHAHPVERPTALQIPDIESGSTSLHQIPHDSDEIVTPLGINHQYAKSMLTNGNIPEKQTQESRIKIRRKLAKHPYSPQHFSTELKIPNHNKRQALDALLSSYKQSLCLPCRQPKSQKSNDQFKDSSLVWQITPELLQRIRKYHRK